MLLNLVKATEIKALARRDECKEALSNTCTKALNVLKVVRQKITQNGKGVD